MFDFNNFLQGISKQMVKIYGQQYVLKLEIARLNWTCDIIEVIPNGSFTLIATETDIETRKGNNGPRSIKMDRNLFLKFIVIFGLGFRVFCDKQFSAKSFPL